MRWARCSRILFPSLLSFFSPAAALCCITPAPPRLSLCSDPCSEQVSKPCMAFSGRPGGPALLCVGPRPDAASQAPRAGTRPRGPGSLYTVRRPRRLGRDGGRFALGSSGPRGFVLGTCRLSPRPSGDVMGGRAALDPAARSGDVRGTCCSIQPGEALPLLRRPAWGMCGDALPCAARKGRDHPDFA